LGGRDRENHDSRPAWPKIARNPTSTNKSQVWWCTIVISAMWEVKRRTAVQFWA
jgi:hypothetical protein